tara:strand:- start:713 stop:1549 length:837 start_codon:yes stop_codon:yes gene_type:complete
MSTQTGRDDFIISIRSAFLNKGTRQKFSLFTLLIISILVLSLEYFETGLLNKFRSFTKDFIFNGSYYISAPFKTIEENYNKFQDHMSMYERYEKLKEKDLNLESLKYENEFFKAENYRLKKMIEEKTLISDDYIFTKVLLDRQSPYLKSVIINKGFKHGLKNGIAVKEKSYYVGKIVEVNHLTSRVLLASDLNSKIPVIVEPSAINAILSGNGNSDFAELEYLPKDHGIQDGYIVYTSGIDGAISEAIPVGKIFIENDRILVKFFANFNQIKYVKVVN